MNLIVARMRGGVADLWRVAAHVGFWPCLLCSVACAGENLLPDPSFEEPKPKDRWGLVFAKWGGWIYEGPCEFRVSDIAHSGQHSLLMVGGTNPKIRASPGQFTLDPGRYRITAYPEATAEHGRRCLHFVKARRRFHFDNYFKRTLHSPTGAMTTVTDAEQSRGFVVFRRDWMEQVFA